MKIAYFTDTFLPQVNGVVTSLLNISNKLAQRGHTILIIAPKHGRKIDSNQLHSRITIKYVSSLPLLLYPDFRLSAPVTSSSFTLIRQFNPDIIHLQTSFMIGGGAILIGKLLNKPIIGSFHAYFMEPEYLKIVGIHHDYLQIQQLLWKFAITFFNQCDVVVSPAHISMRDLITHGMKKPIRVIANTINQNEIKMVDMHTVHELKKQYHLKEKCILYVGRLSEEKCLDTLVKAMVHVVSSVENSSLFIIGDGPSKTSLQKLVEKTSLSDHVVFTGKIEQKKLLTSGYFQTADCFATASTSEIQPVSLIEALYFGLPLVGVDKRGVYEIVKKVGLTAPSQNPQKIADKMVKVISDRDLQKKLSLQSKALFQSEFDSKKIVTQYEKLYASNI